MLKRIFKGPGEPVPVDLLAIQSGHLVLQADKELKNGPMDAEAHVSGVGPIKVRLDIIDKVPNYDAIGKLITRLGFFPRAHLYGARVIQPPGVSAHLAQVLPPLPEDEKSDGRVALRVERRFRVRSRELPGFTAVALDVSMSGIRLEADGWVEPGTTLHLHVELEDRKVKPIDLEAVVRWCEPAATKTHLLGAEFENLGEAAERHLETFIRTSQETEPGVLTDEYFR